MDSYDRFDAVQLKRIGKLYQEKLSKENEVIHICYIYEMNYEECTSSDSAVQLEHLRERVKMRETKARYEIEARNSQQALSRIYERADQLGVLIEDGWFPRVKFIFRRVCNFFQDDPPIQIHGSQFGVPELMMCILVVLFYFYL